MEGKKGKIRIAILEDEALAFKNLSDCIERYAMEHGLLYDLELFSDGMSLVESDFTRFDIIFLDIQVPMVNGLTAAKRIRERDKDVTILFVTNLAQYAIHGYEVEALDYILKPIKYSSMKFRLDRALRRVNKGRDEKKISLLVDRKNVSVNLSDVYYIEANKHRTIYHTAYGTFEVWRSFSDARKELEPYAFAQCHGSFCCNLKWVDKVDGEEVLLREGGSLKMSRNQKKSFMDALTSYWARSGM